MLDYKSSPCMKLSRLNLTVYEWLSSSHKCVLELMSQALHLACSPALTSLILIRLLVLLSIALSPLLCQHSDRLLHARVASPLQHRSHRVSCHVSAQVLQRVVESSSLAALNGPAIKAQVRVHVHLVMSQQTCMAAHACLTV